MLYCGKACPEPHQHQTAPAKRSVIPILPLPSSPLPSFSKSSQLWYQDTSGLSVCLAPHILAGSLYQLSCPIGNLTLLAPKELNPFKISVIGKPPVVQWLRLHASTSGALVWSGQETKIPHDMWPKRIFKIKYQFPSQNPPITVCYI